MKQYAILNTHKKKDSLYNAMYYERLLNTHKLFCTRRSGNKVKKMHLKLNNKRKRKKSEILKSLRPFKRNL